MKLQDHRQFLAEHSAVAEARRIPSIASGFLGPIIITCDFLDGCGKNPLISGCVMSKKSHVIPSAPTLWVACCQCRRSPPHPLQCSLPQSSPPGGREPDSATPLRRLPVGPSWKSLHLYRVVSLAEYLSIKAKHFKNALAFIHRNPLV
ncbi:hypothetical protein AAC387_Pa03g1742 [Persea americana]